MEYYKYVLIYVDDILCFSVKPKEVMDSLSRLYRLKDGSVQTQKVLRCRNFKISGFRLQNGMGNERKRILKVLYQNRRV